MFTVCLDPGHGKYENRSPFSDTFTEGANNYRHALAIKAALEKYDCKVVMTRNDVTENPSLYERAMIAYKAGADVQCRCSDPRCHSRAVCKGFDSGLAPYLIACLEVL